MLWLVIILVQNRLGGPGEAIHCWGNRGDSLLGSGHKGGSQQRETCRGSRIRINNTRLFS